MRFLPRWLAVSALFTSLAGTAIAQEATSESGLEERVAILEAEVAALRKESSELRTLLFTPRIVFEGTEDYEVRGNTFTRHWLAVQNDDVYPEDMFRVVIEQDETGKTKATARTSVDILAPNGAKLYSFLGVKSSDVLKKLWFAVPRGQAPPPSVSIVIIDHEAGVRYQSKKVSLKPSN